MLTTKLKSTQAMAEVVAFTTNKVNPIIIKPFDSFVVSDQCILTLVSFLSKVPKGNKDCHGSCV
jgi:hypothetical protein